MVSKKAAGLFWLLFSKLENNNNCDFSSNGEEFFLDSLLESMKDRKRTLVFVDVGANVGEYTKLLLKKSGKLGLDVEIHLFEPTKKCFDILTEKFSGNDSVILNNFGLSSRWAETDIFYDKETSGLASVYQRNLKAFDIEMDQVERVSVSRFDEYIKGCNMTHIDFLKIDIEGHELEALKGFGSYLDENFINYIQFEYGGANLDSKTSLLELYGLLESKGFSIAKVMPKGIELRGYKSSMENFCYANYVAVSRKVLQ